MNIENLKQYPQWVCFTLPDKKPLNPHTGYGADCNDPSTWSTYDFARFTKRERHYDGIGYEFCKEQGITGVDLDHCIDEAGNVSSYAQEIVKRLNSYTEYSPSRQGLHIWVLGNIPDNIDSDIKADGDTRIEMYDCQRYFTITGQHLSGTPETFENRQIVLLTIYQETIARRTKAKRQTPTTPQQRRVGSDGDTPYGLKALDTECRELASTPNGSRNAQLNRAAFALGQLVTGHELTQTTAEQALTDAATTCGLDDGEIEKTLRSGLESGMQSPRSAPTVVAKPSEFHGNGIQEPDVKFVLDCLSQAEWGDSLLFAHLFKGRVLYDHSEKEWYLWDTHNWMLDIYGRVKHFVSGQLASVYIRAGATLNIQVSKQEEAATDDEEGQKLAKERVSKLKKQIGSLTERAFMLRQVSRNKNVLSFAASQPGMGITSDKWDRNPWLLAMSNGVLELKIGTLRDGHPSDYIRTVCPTKWKGLHAPAPRWEQFLEEIFEDRTEQERQEIIKFLQCIFGYGITGEVREHVFLIFFGEDGRNGKDTLQRAISYALGSVSAAIMKDVLLATDKGKSAGAATPHLSDLQGKRLAWANEPEKGARFNIGQIKDLSGGGDIPTRGLFEKKITKIKPSHLLILLTNHKPQADANDAAFWDRLRLVTFNMRYVDNPVEKNERKKDASLWTALEAEAAGIVAWCVRGGLDWQQNGLATPDSVLQDGKNYREEEDIIHMFLSECCILKNGATVKAGTLYDAYVAWAKGSPHTYVFNRTQLGLELKKKKFEKTPPGRSGVIYKNIGLLSADGEQSVNSQQELFTQAETPSQADPTETTASEREQCEQFIPKVIKNSSRVGGNIELYGKTVHTVHSDMQNTDVNQPIELLEDTVNSSRNYSHSGVAVPDEWKEKALREMQEKERQRIEQVRLQNRGVQ